MTLNTFNPTTVISSSKVNANFSGIADGSLIDDDAIVARHVSADALGKIYPIGCIYIEITGTNPSTTFGFGTWVAFGTGRTIVGYDGSDADFNTSEETGGHKSMQQHSHGVSDPGHDHTMQAKLSLNGTSGTVRTLTTSPSSNQNTLSRTTGISINNAGSGNSGNLQPYIVVYMWKRTA